MNKAAVHQITDALGSHEIEDALNVSRHSIRYARTEGVFPASWYGPLSAMCRNAGIECPLSAFNWKAPAKNIGAVGGDCKGSSK